MTTQSTGEAPPDDSLPASIATEHGTYIHRIRDALKSGSSARVRATIIDVMSRMVR